MCNDATQGHRNLRRTAIVLPVGPKYPALCCSVFVYDSVQHFMLPQTGAPV